MKVNYALFVVALALASLAHAVDPSPAQLPPVVAPTPTMVYVTVPGVETDHSIITSPEFAAWPHISLAEAQRLHAKKGVVFADARAKVEWDQSHIQGALPVPLGEFDKYYKAKESKFKNAKIIVVYCHGVGCHLSDLACKNFKEKGYTNVVNFYGGFPAWTDAKLALVNSKGETVSPTPVAKPTIVGR